MGANRGDLCLRREKLNNSRKGNRGKGNQREGNRGKVSVEKETKRRHRANTLQSFKDGKSGS